MDQRSEHSCGEDQVLILLPTDSNKLSMQWRGPHIVESRVGANDYKVKNGVQDKDLPCEYVEEVYCQRALSGCGTYK